MLCKYIILNIYIDFLTPSSSSSTSFSRILYLLMLRFLRFFTHKFQFIFCFLRFFVFVLRLKFKHIQILYLLLRFAFFLYFLNVFHVFVLFIFFIFILEFEQFMWFWRILALDPDSDFDFDKLIPILSLDKQRMTFAPLLSICMHVYVFVVCFGECAYFQVPLLMSECVCVCLSDVSITLSIHKYSSVCFTVFCILLLHVFADCTTFIVHVFVSYV